MYPWLIESENETTSEIVYPVVPALLTADPPLGRVKRTEDRCPRLIPDDS